MAVRDYVKDRQIGEAYEALLTGVAIMIPEDPWLFMKDKLLFLIREKPQIQWDMFVDPDKRPKKQFMYGSFQYLLDGEENEQPSPEMYEKVYLYRSKKLFQLCMKGWLLFHERAKSKKQQEMIRNMTATAHFKKTFLSKHLQEWKVLVNSYKSRRKEAIAIISKVNISCVCKRVFGAWHESTVIAVRTSKWFKNREKQGEEGNDQAAWYYPEGEDPISLLPIELSTKIFTSMGLKTALKCTGVCRSWKEIIEHPLMWNRVNFSDLKECLTDNQLTKLFKRCRPFLGHLNLRGCSLLTPQGLSTIGECQNLQDLNLSDVLSLNDQALNSILVGCPGLLYLNLSYCSITDSSLMILSRYCTNLRYLSLAFCNQFTSKGLHYIYVGKGCRKLTYLDLSGCTQLAPEGMRFIGGAFPVLNTIILDDISQLSDEMIVAFVSHCHTLRHVSIRGGSMLSDKAVKALVIQSKKLKVFILENNPVVTDTTLKALGKGCRNLEIINVAGCSKISDYGLKALNPLKSLISLNVADCIRISEAGIRYVIESPSGPCIRELTLTNCCKLTDLTLLRFSQRCKSLTYLNLSYCEHITDAGVELLGQMPSLVHIDLRGCFVTDAGVAALQNNPHLKFISLAECSEVTDSGIEKMITSLKDLQCLDLSECEEISDTCIRELAFHCHLLLSVNLAGCVQITDISSKYLAQGCSQLALLDFSRCSVGDNALKYLRKGAHNLKWLDILGCPKVTRDAVQRLSKKASSIKINYSTDQYPSQNLFDFSTLPVQSLIGRMNF